MAARVREHDWLNTRLGPAAAWPAALKRAAEITLGAPMASVLLWGPDFIVAAYNEGYRVILGDKPNVFGQPVLDVWAEERALLEPQLNRVLTGETLLFRELPMSLSRGAESDRSWFDYGYGPVRDDNGAVAGLIVTILEATDRVLAQRAQRESEERQAFLLELSDTLRPLADPIDIMAAASEALGRHLDVGRCAYCEVDEACEYYTVFRDWTDGVMPSMVGRHHFGYGDQFREQYRAGKSVLIDDALADARAAGNEAGFEAAGGFRAAIGLPLIKEGRFVAGLFVMQMEPRHWTAEDEALMLDVAERTWAAVERARAEAALRENEAKYRTLFDTMTEGFAVCDLIRDADGSGVDWRFVEINKAWERQTGVDRATAIGAVAGAILPGMEPFWGETFARVVNSGEPEQVEHYATPIDRWFHASVYPRGPEQFVVVYNDITGRKRAEIALRDSEERQAFLLKLSDALRPLSDPVGIQEAACRALGEHLRVDRAYYVEIDETTNLLRIGPNYLSGNQASLEGEMPVSDYGWTVPILQSGEMIVVNDIHDSPSIPDADRAAMAAVGVQAVAAAPLIKGGTMIGCLAVNCSASRDWLERELELVRETGERIWAAVERARAETALRDSEARFNQFAKASSGGIWIRDAATLAMEYVSPAIGTIYGVEPEAILGDIEKWAAMIVPEDRDIALQHIESARQGASVAHEFRIQRPSDQTFRWIRNIDFPLDQNGHVGRIGGIAEDISEAKLNVEHQAVLLAELQHRVRNIMAIIRSIVSRTADSADSVATYTTLLSGRLLTLARVQALLTRAANATVSITTIVHDELGALATHAAQFEVHGPEVELSPKAAETMTLAIHELTTNALKYGALSAAEGLVEVHWTVVEKRGISWLDFNWSESGAPPRPAQSGPRRQGFGSELIEGRIPYELKGRGAVVIEPGGARCHLEFPLKEGASVLETGAPRPTTVFGGTIDMAGEANLTGRKILVVEDDYYLATDTVRALRGAGAEVLGPCPTEAAAREQIADDPPSGAVLDINLEGGRSFDLAHEMRIAGTPFIFITGYDQEVIPEEFEGVTRLQKPVEYKNIISALAKALDITAYS